MQDVVVIGGGVVGLTIAYELAGTGARVCVVDQSEPGREASWAGAGIFPPAYPGDPTAPLARLTAQSHARWKELTAELAEATGIENGFRRCGGLEFGVGQQFEEEYESWRLAGVTLERLSGPQITKLEPEIHPGITTAYYLPDLYQVRNPWHLNALQAACRLRGVELYAQTQVTDWITDASRVKGVSTTRGEFTAQTFVLAAGAWSGALAGKLGMRLELVPVRGQIALLYDPAIRLRSVLEAGPRYVVPRGDGHVLIGSTEEHVGFDKTNTPEAIAELIRFGASLVPRLKDAPLKQTWAGLRPMVRRRVPWIGRSPRYANAILAAGHYRAGLHLSPATAQLVTALYRNEAIPEWANAFGASAG